MYTSVYHGIPHAFTYFQTPDDGFRFQVATRRDAFGCVRTLLPARPSGSPGPGVAVGRLPPRWLEQSRLAEALWMHSDALDILGESMIILDTT